MKNGQYNLPPWDRIVDVIDGIYERRYYTNHGPLAQRLEQELCDFFEVKHAICMTSMDIALMISLLALDLKGRVLLPAFSHLSIGQNIIWAGLSPHYCDNDPGYPNLTPSGLKKNLSSEASALLVMQNWGDACDKEEIDWLAKEKRLKTLYCSSSVIGQTYRGKLHGGQGDLEIFSFHETQMVNGGDGACVTTNQDDLAARLRNIRSSYGARHAVKIPYTGNGRMSEIQAGLILESLDDLENNRKENQRQYQLYHERLSAIRGAKLFLPSVDNERLNFGCALLTANDAGIAKNVKLALRELGWVDTYDSSYVMDCQTLRSVENAVNANVLKEHIVDLPFGRLVTDSDIINICDVVKQNLLSGHS